METDNTEKKRYKSKKWLHFVLGIITGCLLAALADCLLKDTSCLKDKPVETIVLHTPPLADDATTDSIPVKKQMPATQKTDTAAFAVIEPKTSDTTQMEITEPNNEDVEFSIAPPENNDVIVIDKVISERKIKVINKSIPDSTGVVSHLTITQFDVQQWSTPIKNSISYQKSNQQLRIRGLDISDVEIIFFNNEYYLIKGSISYILKDNNHYERLVMKVIPNPQDL